MSGEIDQISALGDPTRRQIVEFLANRPSSVADLAKQLPVTRSAVSQHLRVLMDSRLVSYRTSGTRHVYHLDPEGLAKLREYLDKVWEKAITEFKLAADQPAVKKRGKP